MKTLFLIFSLLVYQRAHSQSITTFILVRHAEKASAEEMKKLDAKDPDLSEAGRQRALKLAALLKETKVDAIYSTNYKRTQNTVAPLAMEKGIVVEGYEPNKGEAIDAMMKQHSGGTVVVCGHSNTTPWVANYLMGNDDLKNFDDSDYGNVLIIEVLERGKAKLVWLRY